MYSPYDVLGVSKKADAAEVKAAYTRLAAEYYPAHDAASAKKMNELDDAFDELMKKLKPQKKCGENAVPQFPDVRRLISENRLADAEELLDGVCGQSRGAEWNYLKSLILFKRGFLKEACLYIERALDKDADNGEFADLYETLNPSKKKLPGFLSGIARKLRRC